MWLFEEFNMPSSSSRIAIEGSSLYRGRLLPRPLLSSTGLGWKGLVVEHYQAPPCELPDLPVTDEAELQRLGIPRKTHLPGVGQNLPDHFLISSILASAPL